MTQAAQGDVKLLTFDRRWAATVLEWAASPEELFSWAARTDWPLADVSIFDQWHGDAEVEPYQLLVGQEVRAYGEIWYDAAEQSAELGRLMVSPLHRRQGLGRTLVERLVAICVARGCPEIWVRLFPANLAALRCYQSAGFARVSPEQEAALNSSQRFEFVWMLRRG
jgi:GNAT superfamily N-acetyltransferase